MKNTALFVVLSLTGTLAFGAVSAASKGIKIGTVDMQTALQSVASGRSAKKKLEKFFNKRKAELQKEEAEIKKMHEKLQKEALVLNDEARGRKQAEIQQKLVKFQEKTARSQMEIQKKEQELTQPIIQRLRTIIQGIAKKKGYTVVLEKNQNTVLYSLEKDDLTQEVIGQFNKKK